MSISNQEYLNLLQNVKTVLSEFPEESCSLETELESAAKHIPTYLKIIKSHIEQLKSVLKLDSHNSKTLEDSNLATPVLQLIEIFENLTQDDLSMLETLARNIKSWNETTETKTADTELSVET